MGEGGAGGLGAGWLVDGGLEYVNFFLLIFFWGEGVLD